MKKEFLNYSVEELLDKRPFIDFVVHGKNQNEWEAFLAENPQFETTAKKARKIIELLHDRHEPISGANIRRIWKNIDQFDDQIKNHSREIKIHRFMRYAAILITGLLIGGSISYWMLIQNQKSYVFSTDHKQGSDTHSRLLLSDGTSVDLEKENSEIAINADKQIVIDNNKVIDLSSTSNPDEAQMNEVDIPFGKKSQLILEDGTKVWLNAGSKLAFPTKFSGEKREVFLEGEAYFEVAQNKKFPFYVNTNDIQIKVLGTKFNISAYPTDAQIETFLLEGKLAVSERTKLGFLKNETFIVPSQKASYNKEQKTMAVSNEHDIEFAIAWTEGWFMFSQQNLNDVLKNLHRYYNVQFVFEQGFSTVDLITGKLDLKDSIEKVMTALADVAQIQYQIDGDKIHIQKK